MQDLLLGSLEQIGEEEGERGEDGKREVIHGQKMLVKQPTLSRAKERSIRRFPRDHVYGRKRCLLKKLAGELYHVQILVGQVFVLELYGR